MDIFQFISYITCLNLFLPFLNEFFDVHTQMRSLLSTHKMISCCRSHSCASREQWLRFQRRVLTSENETTFCCHICQMPKTQMQICYALTMAGQCSCGRRPPGGCSCDLGLQGARRIRQGPTFAFTSCTPRPALHVRSCLDRQAQPASWLLTISCAPCTPCAQAWTLRW